MKRSNVAPGLLSKRVRFMECPNPERSLQWGTIVGSYVGSTLMLIVLFDNGTVGECDARHLTVQTEVK